MSKKSSVVAEANIIALTLPRAHPMMVVVLVMDLLHLSNQFKIEVFQFS